MIIYIASIISSIRLVESVRGCRSTVPTDCRPSGTCGTCEEIWPKPVSDPSLRRAPGAGCKLKVGRSFSIDFYSPNRRPTGPTGPRPTGPSGWWSPADRRTMDKAARKWRVRTHVDPADRIALRSGVESPQTQRSEWRHRSGFFDEWCRPRLPRRGTTRSRNHSCRPLHSVVVKDLRLKDEDKDEDLSFKDKDKDIIWRLPIRIQYGLGSEPVLDSNNLNLTGAQWQVSHSSQSHCKTMVLDISHDTTLAYSVLENFRGLELPRTRTRTRTKTWKSLSSRILEDKDFPRGQQHWYTVPRANLLTLAVNWVLKLLK